MLHLNSPEGPSTNAVGKPENVVWKVLIFDKFGQDIISSIMRVNDLRENGVTVHMYVSIAVLYTISQYINYCIIGFYLKIDHLCLMYQQFIS